MLEEKESNTNLENDLENVSLENLPIEDKLFLAQDLGDRKHYPQAIALFQQLYSPNDAATLRKWVCMVAEYFEEQGRNCEAIDWYTHALPIQQASNPDEDLRYYVPDYLENKIKFLKSQVYPYKIAVYAICGNEIDNIKDGMTSMGEADYICVLDTGSTDGSYELLQEYQKQNPEKVFIDQKTYNPGRFDTPRNDSLKLVPKEADFCICTDPDERLVPGGANEVRGAWHEGCERLYYLYAWSHLKNGAPARVFGYDKIHKNSGEWYGKFPVHEALYHDTYKHADLRDDQYVFLRSDYVMLHHYPRHKDSRVNYLPLLEMRFEENKEDFYSNVYLSHEYKYHGEYQKCINFITNQSLPYCLKNNIEALFISNLYMFLADSYCALDRNQEAIQNYQMSITTEPLYRDPYLHLASVFLKEQKYIEAIDAVNQGFIKSRKYTSGLEEDTSGNYKPGELLTQAYIGINAIDMARQCAQIAQAMDSENPRLKENLDRLYGHKKD